MISETGRRALCIPSGALQSYEALDGVFLIEGGKARSGLAQQATREMEHLELEREQAEFRFEQEIRELELGERRMQLEHRARNATRPAHKPGRFAHVMWLVCMITHVLMALWVYQDVRKKDNGNGIWIVITLLVGFFGSAVYALIRLGDCPPKVE